MTSLSPETSAEVASTLDDLRGAELPDSTWQKVDAALARMDAALDGGTEEDVRAALVPLSHAAFESKVRTRLGARRPAAAVVVPTKRTPALPVVGAVCGALLLALGWQLGGGLVLAGTALLALLVLVVALAGTRAHADRRARARALPDEDPRSSTPEDIGSALERVRARVVPA